MQHFIMIPALQEDLDTLFRFEQGIITAERPFNETLYLQTR
jgi:hypothetical protein